MGKKKKTKQKTTKAKREKTCVEMILTHRYR